MLPEKVSTSLSASTGSNEKVKFSRMILSVSRTVCVKIGNPCRVRISVAVPPDSLLSAVTGRLISRMPPSGRGSENVSPSVSGCRCVCAAASMVNARVCYVGANKAPYSASTSAITSVTQSPFFSTAESPKIGGLHFVTAFPPVGQGR